jgi:UTP-glucose-1-phosphate uridylyltransferase
MTTLEGFAAIHAGNWREHAAPAVTPKLWTAVIPAAGRGSRLGFDQPKILYPVCGKPILAWLLDLLLPHCQSVTLVLSPQGKPEVEPVLERLAPGRFRIAVQPEPLGMGDAADIGVAGVETPHTAIVWGDQVALRPESVCSRRARETNSPAKGRATRDFFAFGPSRCVPCFPACGGCRIAEGAPAN